MGNGVLNRMAYLTLFAVISVGAYLVIANDIIRFNLNQETAMAESQQPEEILVDVAVVNGDKRDYKVKVQPGVTAFDALVKLDEEEDDFGFKYAEDNNFGAYAKSFNGVEAGKDEFWAFEVNDAESSMGISSYTLVEGDDLSFTLTTF